MSLKIQEQSELNFVSRIIQCSLAIANCPAQAGLGGGDEAYFTRVTFRLYAEEADDAANKVSRRPGAHPARERIVNEVLTLPVITTCKVVTYKRMV